MNLPSSDKGCKLALPLPPLFIGEVAERSEGGGVVNYAGSKVSHQLYWILFSPCRSCRDGHALSYIGEKKGRKDSPLKGDFDSPFELSELKSLLKVFQAWLRQLKDRFLILTEICTPTILSRLPPRSVLLNFV